MLAPLGVTLGDVEALAGAASDVEGLAGTATSRSSWPLGAPGPLMAGPPNRAAPTTAALTTTAALAEAIRSPVLVTLPSSCTTTPE
ncbi:MAG TPA: hypothetical protein VJ301_16440 [Propionibacteriaceae bacterium]|nr:hypothetical protein [Propionibacteriaceae bacterium]